MGRDHAPPTEYGKPVAASCIQTTARLVRECRSFSLSRLATDTLALGQPVRCCLGPFETLTPDTGHAWRTKKKGPGLSAGPLPPTSPRVRRLAYSKPSYGSSTSISTVSSETIPTTPMFSLTARVGGTTGSAVSSPAAATTASVSSITPMAMKLPV